MAVIGFTKVRNEEHIIQATLNSWARWCDGGIFVYDDVSADDTRAIAEDHPAVREVIASDLFDPDRERAEWYNRRTALQSLRRFLEPGDWVAYFDADEWLEEFDPVVLAEPLEMVACRMFDVYITRDDADLEPWLYHKREYVAPEYEYQPFFYRGGLPWDITTPDQRVLSYGGRVPADRTIIAGIVRHWGKGISPTHFDAKCDYYAKTFGPKYAEKWAARKGHAVHDVSDFGQEFVQWVDVLDGSAETMWRRSLTLIS